MRGSTIKRVIYNSFWLSLLLHLLLLLFYWLMIHKKEEKKIASEYIPAYVYQKPIKSPYIERQYKVAKTKSVEQQPVTKAKVAEKETQGIDALPETTERAIVKKQKKSTLQSIMASSYEVLDQMQDRAIASHKDVEPLYLIGADNGVSDPFIILIGKSISKNFKYPRREGELGITGTVVLSMTLHPDGYFRDVEVVRSSYNQNLDAAALYAVNAAPPVRGADKFISAPKNFVFGFVFH